MKAAFWKSFRPGARLGGGGGAGNPVPFSVWEPHSVEGKPDLKQPCTLMGKGESALGQILMSTAKAARCLLYVYTVFQHVRILSKQGNQALGHLEQVALGVKGSIFIMVLGQQVRGSPVPGKQSCMMG